MGILHFRRASDVASPDVSRGFFSRFPDVIVALEIGQTPRGPALGTAAYHPARPGAPDFRHSGCPPMRNH
jgi:hypothetical protein